MNMEAFILGCGGMMPLPRRHLTSVLLRRDGDLFLFDGGEGTQVSLRALNLKWKKINAIFVSHTHADHVTGLPGILMLSAQVDRDEPLYIYGPPRIAEYIETSRRVLDMYINYPIVVNEITAPCVVYGGEGFYVRAFPLSHTKTCVGYTLEELPRPGEFSPEKALALGVPRGPLWGKLQHGGVVEVKRAGGSIKAQTDGKTGAEGQNSAEGAVASVLVRPEDVMGPERSGRKFSFVTDTLYRSDIAEQVRGSDLLVCEGMFEEGLKDQAREKKHMTALQAARIARDAAVDRMLLIHYSPRYTDRQLSILLDEARSVFPKTQLSSDRMQIDIPYKD